MKKRLLSLVLTLAMVLSFFPGMTITANAEEVLPVITSQPKDVNVPISASWYNLSLAVIAEGEDLEYQWEFKKDGNSEFTAITGANQSTYKIGANPSSLKGEYHCVVTNSAGSVTSDAAKVIDRHFTYGGRTTGVTDKAYPYGHTDFYADASNIENKDDKREIVSTTYEWYESSSNYDMLGNVLSTEAAYQAPADLAVGEHYFCLKITVTWNDGTTETDLYLRGPVNVAEKIPITSLDGIKVNWAKLGEFDFTSAVPYDCINLPNSVELTGEVQWNVKATDEMRTEIINVMLQMGAGTAEQAAAYADQMLAKCNGWLDDETFAMLRLELTDSDELALAIALNAKDGYFFQNKVCEPECGCVLDREESYLPQGTVAEIKAKIKNAGEGGVVEDYIEFTFDDSEFTPLFYGQRDSMLNNDQVEAAFATEDKRVRFWDSHAGDYFDSYVTGLKVYKKSGETYTEISQRNFLQIGDEIYLQVIAWANTNDIDFTNTKIKVNGEAVEVVSTNHRENNQDTITFRFKLGPVLAKIAVAEDIIGGTVSVDKTTAEKGEVVTVTATPDSGYVLNKIVYSDTWGDGGSAIEGNTFEVPGYNVLVTAKFVSENIVTIDRLDIKLDKAAESLEARDFFCEKYIPFTVSQSGVTIKYSGWLIKATQDHFNNGCLYDESQIGEWTAADDFARVPELTDTDTFALNSAVEVDGVNYQFADTIVNASDFDNFYHNGNYIEFKIAVGTLADIRAAQNAGEGGGEGGKQVSEVTVTIDWDKIAYNAEGYPELNANNVILTPDVDGAFNLESWDFKWYYYDESEDEWYYFYEDEFSELLNDEYYPGDTLLAIEGSAELLDGYKFASELTISSADGNYATRGDWYGNEELGYEAYMRIQLGTKESILPLIKSYTDPEPIDSVSLTVDFDKEKLAVGQPLPELTVTDANNELKLLNYDWYVEYEGEWVPLSVYEEVLGSYVATAGSSYRIVIIMEPKASDIEFVDSDELVLKVELANGLNAGDSSIISNEGDQLDIYLTLTLSESHQHSYTYTTNNNGTHNVTCNSNNCDYAAKNQPCWYFEGECKHCHYVEPVIPDAYDVTVTVKEQDEPCSNAEVTLVSLVGNKKTVAVGDENGVYTFENIEKGLYNLEIKSGDRVKTILVTVAGANVNLGVIDLPAMKVNSTVEVEVAEDSAVKGALVGGLDTLADNIAADNTPGSSDTQVSVDVTMNIETQMSDTVEEEKKDKITETAQEQSANLTFLDIAIEKVVTTIRDGNSDGGVTSSVNDTGILLEIVIPFDTTGKNSFAVYRYHDENDLGSDVQKLTTDAHPVSGEYISVDLKNKTITLHVKYFSTYAIGYTVVNTGGGYIPPAAPPVKPAEPVSYDKCKRDGECPLNNFVDLSVDAWYHDAVHYCIDEGLMNGYGSTFRADGVVTRQQVWMMLARLSGEDPANMAAARVWAMENGVSDGTNPTNAVTRQQFITMLYRYAVDQGYDVSVGEDTNILSYADAFSVSEYAIPAMQWGCGSGIMGGYADGSLKPVNGATRAHVAAFLQRFCVGA